VVSGIEVDSIAIIIQQLHRYSGTIANGHA